MNPSAEQIDGLKELINIGVGRAASILNTMLSSHIVLQVPFVKLLTSDDFKNEIDYLGVEQLAAVELGFKGIFSGSSQLIFTTETAHKLVATLVGDNPVDEDIDAIKAGTLAEIGNIVLNGVMGSISNMLQLHFEYSVPNYLEGNAEALLKPSIDSPARTIILARTRFVVEKLHIDGDIALFFELIIFNRLLNAVNSLSSISRG
ncbi:Chemotaxis protein, CheC-like [Desulfonema limicola]|uniref:Chemotaxis protein, CheC-like n=1 Tax=Desulfonema limicola TaxID=45656 RepID=A0A975B3F3_9BACT|nr:chemotaxis protein CheX [Desulfonema limicola]QTA78080.1 Chemotaxis protein, CheC-like [Desulfonema limicola]